MVWDHDTGRTMNVPCETLLLLANERIDDLEARLAAAEQQAHDLEHELFELTTKLALERGQSRAYRAALERIAAVQIEDDSQPLYATAAAHAECVYIARAALNYMMTERDDAGRELEWHFWPRKNAASIANREGLRLDFASHNAAILGKAYLEQLSDHKALQPNSVKQRGAMTQDCIRCGKPLRDEDLEFFHPIEPLEHGEPVVYVYRHRDCPAPKKHRQWLYSRRFIVKPLTKL